MKKSFKQMKGCFIVLLVTFAGTINLPAQNIQKIKPLKRGDTVPDYLYKEVCNYSKDNLRLSEFKGKLIILDFWGPACIGCINGFPRMDSLQKIFPNDLQIILITRETADSINRFFNRRKRIKKPDLPCITSDKVLEKLFPHMGVPHHVWIDQSGVVKFIPESYYTTEETIRKVLGGTTTYLADKKKSVYTSSFFDPQWQSALQYYSYFSRCDERMHLETSEKIKGAERITYGCKSIIMLYEIVLSKFTSGVYSYSRPWRILVETNDSTRFFKRPNESNPDWIEKYGYNYQLMVPESMKGRIYSILKDELDRFYNCESRIEKREVPCYVLTRTGSEDKMKSKGGESRNNFWHSDLRSPDVDTMRYYTNLPFEGFSDELKTLVESLLHRPYKDSVGYTGNVDIQMEGRLLDSLTLPELRKELQRYNLDLVEGKVLLDVMIIKSRE